MGRFLFTIGLGVTEKPDHWRHVCAKFGDLACGLRAFGVCGRFVVNPLSFVAQELEAQEVTLGGHAALAECLSAERFDFGFVWGGRFAPDGQTVELMRAHDVTPVFGELAWFPQKDGVYFDLTGTNTQMAAVDLPALGAPARHAFEQRREAVVRRIYGCAPLHPAPWPEGKPMRVFVPLQDESDTNITMDSPFRSMNDFVAFLSETYPACQFTIRPHPRAEIPHLDRYPNVTRQGAVSSVVAEMRGFDLVAGINSTLLAEAALLGHRVVCFGDGIAARFGLAPKLDRARPPRSLWQERFWTDRSAALAWLLEHKQLDRQRLNQPDYLRQSYLMQMLAL